MSAPDDTQPCPVSTPPPDVLREERARVAYTAFWDNSPGASPWEKLNPTVRESWCRAAEAAAAYEGKIP